MSLDGPFPVGYGLNLYIQLNIGPVDSVIMHMVSCFHSSSTAVIEHNDQGK